MRQDDPRRPRYDYLTAVIRRLREDCDTHFYEVGLHLAEVTDGRLHLLGDYDTLAQYIDEARDPGGDDPPPGGGRAGATLRFVTRRVTNRNVVYATE